MPLSEHEQRILDEIERRLAAEDPKFARASAQTTPRGMAMRRIKRAVAGFVLGLGLLLSGLFTQNSTLLLLLGLAGFGVMLASIALITRATKDMARVAATPSSARHLSWFDRLEERWRKRSEHGDDEQ